jgi:3-hydroxyisobutyrate dehydrogenase
MKIALLGLGAMGSRMAMNLLKAGYDLTVWNRTSASAEELVAAGAKQAETPAVAAVDADVVISMVRDDEASESVWLHSKTGALHNMKAGAIGIESSTLSFDWIKKLGKVFTSKNLSFLEAPVSGSRPQALAGQLIYIVGGDAQIAEKVGPLLSTMGCAIHYTGPLGSAALVKLSTNTLLGVQVTVVAELIGMLKRNGVDPSRAFDVIANTAVCSPFAARSAMGMLMGDFSPQFTTELVAKDFHYATKAAGDHTLAPTILAANQVFNEAVARGCGDENLTSVVKLFS